MELHRKQAAHEIYQVRYMLRPNDRNLKISDGKYSKLLTYRAPISLHKRYLSHTCTLEIGRAHV